MYTGGENSLILVYTGFVEYGDVNNNSSGINSTIYGGEATKGVLIENQSSNDLVIGGKGNDGIANRGDNVTIDVGDGNDRIQNDGSNVTIYGGVGENTIISHGSNNLIVGGDDDDTISTGGSSRNGGNCYYDTIVGGKGDDAIYKNSGRDKDIYFYNLGDGNDTINYFGANDTLMIANSDYTTIKDGSLVIVQVGEGSVILTGLGDNSPKIKTTSKNISIPSFDNITIPTNTFNESVDSKHHETVRPIEKPSSIPTIASGSSNTPSNINNTSDNSSSSNNTPSNSNNTGNNTGNTIINGDVIINNYYYNNTTSTYNNTYVSNTYITNNIFVYESGSKTLTNFNSNDTLNFAATYTDWAIAGNDLVINSAEGAVRITDAQNKLV